MKDKYIRVAERAVEAGQAVLNAGKHEKAGFLAYHAFESSGSALGTHIGLDMGKTVAHAAKLIRFRRAAHTVGLSRVVADLSIRLASMRNRFLYPEEQLDGTKHPRIRSLSRKQRSFLERSNTWWAGSRPRYKSWKKRHFIRPEVMHNEI